VNIELHWREWLCDLRAEQRAEWNREHQWWLLFRPRTGEAIQSAHDAEVLARDIHADGTPTDEDEWLYPDGGPPQRLRFPLCPGGLTPRQAIGSAKCFS
jgi:hypothetical protein